ncbi:hypothetical protein [Nonomuraea sp. SBT364]|uniref:hypothetical protein n=1 Tax=Nonomuraea sp. SBT364 TaxID=1580530 RepID=UPI00066D8296|nr:hypothetical protein [Nonomuraea sp. SBT364]
MKRLVLAWAAIAVAATGAAVAVLGLVGGALTGTSGEVMTQDEARAALASATPKRPAASPSAAPSAPPSGEPSASPSTPSSTQPSAQGGEFVRTPGGTVIASCDGDLATLRSWSPAQGYSVDGVEPGPAPEVQVEFEADEGEDVELSIGCQGGRPVTLPG